MTTYYVSPAGSNTSPYDSWAKAANLPHTLVATNPSGGPHTINIAPGTYSSYLTLSHANWAGVSVYGRAAHGSATPAADGQVIISYATQHLFFAGQAGITCECMEFSGTDATHDTLYVNAANFTGRHLRFRNAGHYLIYALAAGMTLEDFLCEGNDGSYAVVLSTNSTGTLSYGIVRNSATKLITGIGIRCGATGTWNVNNVSVLGQKLYAIAQYGTGTINFKNGIFAAGSEQSYIGLRSAGAMNVDHSLLIRSPWTPSHLWSGTVGDTNNIVTAKTGWNTRARSGFVTLSVDDTANYDLATAVAPKLRAAGIKGTFFVYRSGLDVAESLAGVQALIADYSDCVEIGCHSYFHTDLDNTATDTVFTVTKTGKTINVDRTADTITVSDTGTVTGFKAKTLDAIKAELVALGCTCGDYLGTQSGSSWGEIMADSSGAQASPYAIKYLIDVTAATGFFYVEMTQAKAEMESLLGITINSLSAPGGKNSANANLAAIAAGFTSFSNNGTTATFLLDNIDLSQIKRTAGLVACADDATTVAAFRSICEFCANFGAITSIILHTVDDMSLSRWDQILAVIGDYPEVTFGSMGDAVDEITDSGDWTAAGGSIYTRVWTTTLDDTLTSGSDCIDAGVAIAGVTEDAAGNPVPLGDGPDIGRLEYTWPPSGTITGTYPLAATSMAAQRVLDNAEIVAAGLDHIDGGVAMLDEEGTGLNQATLTAALAAAGVAATPTVNYTLAAATVGAAPRADIVAYQYAAISASIVAATAQTGDSHALLVYDPAVPGTVVWSLTTAAGEISVGVDGVTLTIVDTDAHTGTAGTYAYVLRNTTDDAVVCVGSFEIKAVPNVPSV
jgi:hypothetical protein